MADKPSKAPARTPQSPIPQHKRLAMGEKLDTGGGSAKGPKTRP